MMIAPLLSKDCPVLLVGAPGCGKTALVRAAADHVEVILTSAMVEEDIAGLPYREGAEEHRTIPGAIARLIAADAAGKKTILFLDEIDKARRSVADTLLTLVASRRAGEVPLPAATAIVAAANPADRAGGDGVSEAMRSRFAVVPFAPDVAAWAAWARATYRSSWAQAVIDAVDVGELPLLDDTRADDELAARTTCPRTLALALATIDRLGADDELATMTLLSGLLTPSVASRVAHYRPTASVPSLARTCRRAARARTAPEPIRL